MTALSALEAYRIWAPSYSDETAISYLEDKLVAEMTPDLAAARLLDAGCGTGRRLRKCSAAVRVGLDVSAEMLSAGGAQDGQMSGVEVVVGDVRAMPFGERGFDVLWCRLVLGHLPRIEQAYAELARVADIGATIIVSDFHPAAWDAGHRRSFRSGDQIIEVEHHVHRPEQHVVAARAAGLTLIEVRDALIGNDVLPIYDRAGRGGDYEAQVGLPVVLALSFRRER